MGFRGRWRLIPPGERVEILLAAVCVVTAYVVLATAGPGRLYWAPQLVAAALCVHLAWRQWRA